VGFPARIALATRNRGKIREILQICSEWPVRWLTWGGEPGLEWPDVEETGETYLENARKKAVAVARALGVAAIADDSGIEVDALGGGPGPLSARFAGAKATERENLDLLIERIRGFPPEERTARYRCLAVCARPGSATSVWGEGVCEGRLILEPRGVGGFGYDPIFVPEGHDRTMAELSAGEKNAISHRGRAFRALGDTLRRDEPP
jgi:XTP/dITP diphosphohydrolase